MVKIPELALDGQNWKFYCVKYLEAAATNYCLDILGGRPDNGTDDWEEANALLCDLFMETIPASIYFQIHLNSAHKIYKYLSKRFSDNDSIEDLCTKKFAVREKEAKCHTRENSHAESMESPTSENAAMERHADAKRDGVDLPCTQDLTRGTQDVNDGNVGRTQDPCTSLEASVQGTSTKCAETTPVVLKSVLPHETQTEPHSSLPLTPRPPIEGKPNRCKQEAADSVVTAGRTKRTVETAEPTIVDVNGKATLGREPAGMVHRVNKGGEECEPQLQLQQTEFYCKEDQCNANANGDVPVANRLPLEGEWTAYPSGKTTDSKGVELEGRESSTDERVSIDEADGGISREAQPTDMQNEPTELLTTTVEPYVDDGDTSPLVRIGGTNWCAGSAKGPGC